MYNTLAEDQAETIMKLAELPEKGRKTVLGFATGLVLAYKATNPDDKKSGGQNEKTA